MEAEAWNLKSMVLKYYRRWQKQKRGVDKPHFGELRAQGLPASCSGRIDAHNQYTPSGDRGIPPANIIVPVRKDV
jgi:hypothetical protein